MNFIKIICPNCNAEAKLSLVDTDFSGPRRCWKCRSTFTITIQNNRLTSCVPMSQEDFEKWQEERKAAEKAKESGLNFYKREEPPARPVAQPQQLEFFRPNIPNAPNTPEKPAPPKRQESIKPHTINTPKEPTRPTETLKPGTTFPPDRPRVFIPNEDTNKKEPEKKPQKPKGPPPDRFNLFIPPQT